MMGPQGQGIRLSHRDFILRAGAGLLGRGHASCVPEEGFSLCGAWVEESAGRALQLRAVPADGSAG